MTYHDADQEQAFGPCPVTPKPVSQGEVRLGKKPEPIVASTPDVTIEGRKDDDGKERIELVPPELIFATAQVLTFGAKKYAARNWEKGMAWSRVFGALMRHMWSWWAGKGPSTKNFAFGHLDTESGFSHLWHASACLAFLVAFEERGTGDDDRPLGKR